jgi:hypothetical protein
MASRLDDLRMVDPVLSTIAQGYQNSAMIFESLFPQVSVSKLKGKIPVFGKESFIARDTERAVRAASNRIPPSDLNLVTFSTKERDIETAIDYLEEEESHEFYKYEQRIAKHLSDILILGKEVEAAELAQAVTSYGSGMYHELEYSEAFNNNGASVTPIQIINDGKEAVRNKIALYPNTMVIGISAYKTLCNHSSVLERIRFTGVARVTTQILSEVFEIPDIVVGTAVHSTDGDVFTDIWQDNIVLAYIDKANRSDRSEFNPSFGYTFQREGMPEIDYYYENGGKIKVIRNTDNYGMLITGSDAGFLIKNVIQSES